MHITLGGFMKKIFIMFFLTCFYAFSAEDMTISFINHKFDPLVNTPKLRSSLQTTEIEGENYYILQFTGPIYTSWKEQISNAGGIFHSYIPHFAYIVQMTPEEKIEMEKFPFVRWIGLFHPEYKIHPSVYKENSRNTENKRPMITAEFKDNKLEVLEKKECTNCRDALWVPNDPLLHLSVTLFSGTSVENIAHKLETWGSNVQQIQNECPSILVRIPADSLNALARMREIQSIVRYSKRTLSSSVWRYSVQVPMSSFTIQQDQDIGQPMDTVTSGITLADKGITGEGEIITIFDSGLDYWNGFFQDPENDPPGPSHIAVEAYTAEGGDTREVATNNDPYGCFHGTNVASIVAGNPSIANNHPNGANLMPIYDWGGQTRGNTIDHFPVRLYIQDFGFLDGDTCKLGSADIPTALNKAYITHNSKIHQNSWNYSEDFAAGEYLGTAVYDNMVWNNKDFVVVFSAGNFGPDTSTVRPPSTAKNCISVGSSWIPSFDVSSDSISDFSGRGWTTDGRIKPEVVAPGGTTPVTAYRHYAWGAYPNTGWAADSAHTFINGLVGTSQAAPQISAMCAMIRQYFTDGFYPTGDTLTGTPFNPSAALVKAILIASAVDIKNGIPVPNREEGWGRVVLDNALYFSGESNTLFVSDDATGVTTADSVVYMVNIVYATDPIKFVLAWSDIAATEGVGVNPTLVNDLDLIVTAPNSNRYLGNVFSNGFSQMGGTADRKNNVEVVLLPSSATTGTYHVTVRGYNCPNGSIPFAIVALEGNQDSSGIPDEYESSTGGLKYLNIISPFFENTNIKLNIKITSDVNLSIYDLSGRKITTLINERLNKGTYATTWGSKETSGIYFATLKINGKEVEKSKIIKIAK
jgi:hypothetical protein